MTSFEPSKSQRVFPRHPKSMTPSQLRSRCPNAPRHTGGAWPELAWHLTEPRSASKTCFLSILKPYQQLLRNINKYRGLCCFGGGSLHRVSKAWWLKPSLKDWSHLCSRICTAVLTQGLPLETRTVHEVLASSASTWLQPVISSISLDMS